MFDLGKRLLADATVLGLAALLTGVGVALSTADEPKTPDLADLRDAVKAAGKRGENVDEIRKALDGLEKSLARGWTAPAPGRTIDPPAELVALRDAVEAAAKKGENVEAIRTQLEVVEKAITGKVLARPKPLPPPISPVRPGPIDPAFPPFPFPQQLDPLIPQFPQFPQPVFPGGGIDAEAIQKAQETMRKAIELRLKNPDDPEAIRLMEQSREMMLKAMLGGRGGIAPGLLMPDMNVGRVPERFRLGVRLERVSELAADQLGLEVARGVGIVAVVDGSPADKAGFKPHDVVIEFGGKPVTDNPEDFTRQVNEAKAGEKMTAVVIRKSKKVELTGIELPDAQRLVPRAVPVPVPNLRPVPRPGVTNPNALPDLGPRPGGVGFGNLDGRGRGGNSVAVTVSNGQLTIKAHQDGVTYLITGLRNGDETEVSKITITDGDKTIEAEKLDKVPDRYKPTVEQLIKGNMNPARR